MDAANIFRRLLIQNLDQEEGRFLGFVHSVQIDPVLGSRFKAKAAVICRIAGDDHCGIAQLPGLF